MKRRAVVLPLILGLVVIAGCSGAVSSSGSPDQRAVSAVVDGNNAFAFDLYGEIAEKEAGNLFLSPFSISSALAMTYVGARGDTAAQMKRTLHFDSAAEDLNPGFSALMKRFNTSGKSYQLSVANALWGQKGTEFYPEFVDITRKYHDAGFMEVDYTYRTEEARQTINGWVEEKTNRKIVNLIPQGALDSLTRLVLTNAIYFKGRWEAQFDPKQTEEAPFFVSAQQNPNVPLMHRLGKFKYGETDEMQILELPYIGGEVVMDVLLPKPGFDMGGLEAGLRQGDIESWLAASSNREVSVYLPRFKMEKSFSLSGPLQDLGMTDAFDENLADFSGMSKTFLYITHVIHKAFVEVNEEGTEAAAATAVVMGTKAAPMDAPPVFRADHPFLFLIRDVQSGSILFIGRLADPRQ